MQKELKPGKYNLFPQTKTNKSQLCLILVIDSEVKSTTPVFGRHPELNLDLPEKYKNTKFLHTRSEIYAKVTLKNLLVHHENINNCTEVYMKC